MATSFIPMGPATAAPAGASSPSYPTATDKGPYIIKAQQNAYGPGTSATVKPVQSLPHPWTGTQG